MSPTFQFQKSLQGTLQVIESMKEMAQSSLNHCPDQKGIKTSDRTRTPLSMALNHCHDQKGIKTYLHCRMYHLQISESLP